MQIVESVEEDRLAAPPRRRGTKRVERSPRMEFGVYTAELAQAGRIGAVDGCHVPGVGVAARILRRPTVHGRRKPLGRHERALELGDQLARRVREARRAGRLAQRVELEPGHRALKHPLALKRGEAPAGVPGPAGDLAREPGEGQHRAEQGSLGRELPGVIAGVGRCRDDEDRAAGRGGSEGSQHLAGLGGVGGSQYEGERHHPHSGACSGRGTRDGLGSPA